MKASCNLDELDEVFFEYITRATPKSNEDLTACPSVKAIWACCPWIRLRTTSVS
jgi:hypothetical protein